VLGRKENERRERRKRWRVGAYQVRERGAIRTATKWPTMEASRQSKSDAKQPRAHAFSRRSPSERAKAFKPTWLIPEAAEDAWFHNKKLENMQPRTTEETNGTFNNCCDARNYCIRIQQCERVLHMYILVWYTRGHISHNITHVFHPYRQVTKTIF
jgi:hypothetical protein